MSTEKIDLLHDRTGHTPAKNRLLGVNAGPYRYKYPIDKASTFAGYYSQLGVTSVRTHDFYGPFDLDEIYCFDTEAYDFSRTDEAFKYIILSGAEVYLRIGYSYYTEDGKFNDVLNSRTKRSQLCKVVLKIINRYTRVDYMDESDRDQYKGKVDFIELWNEPDHSKFWPVSDSEVESFASFFWEMVRAIRADYPKLKIGGPGFTHDGYKSDRGEKIIDCLLEQQSKNSENKLDFISWHAYKDKADDFQTRFEKFHSKFGEPIGTHNHHITEWNLTKDTYENGLNCYEVVSLTTIWIWMNIKGIHQAHFFRGIHEDCWAVLNSDNGMNTPLADMFQQWSRFAQGTEGKNDLYELTGEKTEAILSKTVNDKDGFWGIGAYGKDNKSYYMLLANLSNSSSDEKGDTYRYQISTPSGQSGFSTSDITIHKITSNGTYQCVEGLSNKSMDLRRNAVHIVKIDL